MGRGSLPHLPSTCYNFTLSKPRHPEVAFTGNHDRDLVVLFMRGGTSAIDPSPTTLKSVPVGFLDFPAPVVQVMATGTTAAAVIAYST